MTNKIDQKPGELHVEIVKGNGWTKVFDFNMDLSGYTIEALFHPADGSDDVVIAATPIDLVAGQFSLTFTATNSGLQEPDYHSWCLDMYPTVSPELVRTYLAGRFIIGACA